MGTGAGAPAGDAAKVLELPTPQGPARAQVRELAAARGTLVLGHGAGGAVDAPDLTAVSAVATSLALTVVLLEQPYRVAGRRSPAPAGKLDEAWIAAVATLRERQPGGSRLVLGGRSSGARVACRTASALRADAVLCLAFPLQPTRRRRDGTPAPSRLAELDSVSVPTLVVQGATDPFGMPAPAPHRQVVTVRGDHGLKGDLNAVAQAAREWLSAVL